MIQFLLPLIFIAQLNRPLWIIVAPGIEAKTDSTMGSAAYDVCMATLGTNPMSCAINQNNAVLDDVNNRFIAFLADLVKGEVNSKHSLNVYLNFYNLRLSSYFTPFGTITPFGPK